MKVKIKSVLFVLLAALAVFALWVFEPISINPFAVTPKVLSNSKSQLTCGSKPLGLKADSILNNAMFLNDFVGASTAMYSAACGSWCASAGYAKKGKQKAADTDTKFRIASISKPMTAVAIMQLYEQNKISLDAPIQEYLPSYPVDEKGPFTIRQLLQHRSGVRHYNSDFELVKFKQYENMLLALDYFKDDPLKYTPGTAYLYTTYGYSILGAIIEKVTGQSFQAYMHENIWQPAEMYNTMIEDANMDYDNKANLYIKWGQRFIKSPKTNLSVKYPGGGIQSTGEDLVKFGKAIINHTLIDSTSLAMMIEIKDTLKEGTPYGFGWDVIQSKSFGRIIQHGGSQSGASSFLKIYLDEKVCSAIIANNFNSSNEVYFLARDLGYLLVDSTKMDRSVNYFIPQKVEILDRYVGQYEFEDEQLNISREGNQLFAQTNPYPKVPIFPNTENEFFYRIMDARLQFELDENKKKIATFNRWDEHKVYQIKD